MNTFAWLIVWSIVIAAAAGLLGVFFWRVADLWRHKDTPRWAVLPYAFAGTVVIVGIIAVWLVIAAIAAIASPLILVYAVGKAISDSWEEFKDALLGGLIIWPILTILTVLGYTCSEGWSKFFPSLCVFGAIYFFLFVLVGPLYEVFANKSGGGSTWDPQNPNKGWE